MATTTSLKKDWEDIYSGFDVLAVGPGTLEDLYSDPNYAKKKIQKLVIGGISRISYTGWENDAVPLILVIGYVAKYNVVLGYNLRYAPQTVRENIIKYVVKTNLNRIKKQQPIIIDYHSLKRVIPISSKIVRMYKLPLIRVIESVPLNGWGIVIKEKSKFASHYKRTGKSSETIAQRFFRSIRGFFK